jgi:hypothetical protein
MTGVALLDRSFDEASAPESCGESRLCATSVPQKSCRYELFGLTGANPDDDQRGDAALIEASERRLASFCFACSF